MKNGMSAQVEVRSVFIYSHYLLVLIESIKLQNANHFSLGKSRFYSTHDADRNRISLGSWGLMSVLDYHQDVRRSDRN